MICTLSEPIQINKVGGQYVEVPPYKDGGAFAYKTMTCDNTGGGSTTTPQTSLITDTSTGRFFYLNRDISYGDLALIFMFCLFFVSAIAIFVFRNFIRRF